MSLYNEDQLMLMSIQFASEIVSEVLGDGSAVIVSRNGEYFKSTLFYAADDNNQQKQIEFPAITWKLAIAKAISHAYDCGPQ